MLNRNPPDFEADGMSPKTKTTFGVIVSIILLLLIWSDTTSAAEIEATGDLLVS